MEKKILTALIMVICLSLFSQLSLSLDESIELAKKGNKDLEKAREEVGKYRQEYNNVRGNLLPQVSLSGGYQFKNTHLPDSAVEGYETLSSFLDDSATETDNTIAYYIDSSFSSLLPDQDSDEHTLAGNLELSQVIFMGGKLINGIKVADKLYHLQEKKYDVEEQNLIYETIELYYQTKLAGEVVLIQQKGLELAELYHKQVEDMYDEGLVSEYDLLRAELEVQKLKPQVMEAEKNHNLALENLADHLDIEETNLELTDEIILESVEEITLDSAIEEALAGRKELELSQIGVSVSEVLLKYEKGNFLPNIGLTAEYSVYGLDESKIEDDDWGNSYQVGIGFSMPLFTGLSNTSKIKKAKHSLRQSQLDHQSLQELIELDVRNSFLQWQADQEKVITQQQNEQLAEKGLEIANARYENQVSNQLEVIDAQLQLRGARLSSMNAQYSALISYKKLIKAMGRKL